MFKKWMVLLSLVLLLYPFRIIATDRVLLEGEYSYTYGDNETVVEAKNISFKMALRNTIESYKIFILSTSTVKNFRLINDLIQVISSGYLEDIKIISQKIEGRSVTTKVQAYVVPKDIQNIIENKVKSTVEKGVTTIDSNECIEVLSVIKGDIFDQLLKDPDVLAKLKLDADESSNRNPFVFNDGEARRVKVIIKSLCVINHSTDNPLHHIGINLFDKMGNPIAGYSKSPNAKKMIPGQIGTVLFNLPENAKSYEVFLVK